jgi:predicted ATP-dependent endonuclease of OLD family
MKVSQISIRNFRRLENVTIDVEDRETVFVGPNNSGKTSATAAFRSFVGNRDFRVHDLSVSRAADIHAFVESGDETKLPRIELDVWFSLDPNSVAFGRAFTLLPQLSDDFRKVGIRLSYGFIDPKKLLAAYNASFPEEDGVRARTMTQYLAIDNNFKRNSQISYFSLEEKDGDTLARALDRDEGRKVFQTLVRLDFVDAQRNIDDEDSNRSNRLSAAFAEFYRKNLEQARIAAEANKVIDDNNRNLTDHYKTQFNPLIGLIRRL